MPGDAVAALTPQSMRDKKLAFRYQPEPTASIENHATIPTRWS